LSNPSNTPGRAFVIETDTALLHGISRSVDPLLALFKENGLEMTPWQFIQRVVGATPERFADQAFPAAAKAGLPEAIRSTVLTALQQGADKLVEDVGMIVNELAPKNVKTVLVTALPDTRLKEMLGDALKDRVQVVQVMRSHCFVYRQETWCAVCARARMHTRLCVAVVGSAISCRAALAAGLHAIAAYDPLMEGNDFGGADYVSAKVDKKLIAEGLRRLRLA
jgi:hypothetical protein